MIKELIKAVLLFAFVIFNATILYKSIFTNKNEIRLVLSSIAFIIKGQN